MDMVPLSKTSIGVELRNVGGGPVALAQRLLDGDDEAALAIGDALRKHLIVLIRNQGDEKPGTLSPELIRVIHERVHAARYPGVEMAVQPARSGWTETNIRGSSFPNGYTETQLLGSTRGEKLDSLFGLSGSSLQETAHWTHKGGRTLVEKYVHYVT